jgi:hypothetical protein
VADGVIKKMFTLCSSKNAHKTAGNRKTPQKQNQENRKREKIGSEILKIIPLEKQEASADS